MPAGDRDGDLDDLLGGGGVVGDDDDYYEDDDEDDDDNDDGGGDGVMNPYVVMNPPFLREVGCPPEERPTQPA